MMSNWYYVLFFLVAALICTYACMTGKVIEWLKWAVAIAEQELGTGTGQLKLREVYNMFISTFPVFSKILPFAIFSKLVDVALEWLDIQLKQNANVSALVKGE